MKIKKNEMEQYQIQRKSLKGGDRWDSRQGGGWCWWGTG